MSWPHLARNCYYWPIDVMTIDFAIHSMHTILCWTISSISCCFQMIWPRTITMTMMMMYYYSPNDHWFAWPVIPSSTFSLAQGSAAAADARAVAFYPRRQAPKTTTLWSVIRYSRSVMSHTTTTSTNIVWPWYRRLVWSARIRGLWVWKQRRVSTTNFQP